MRAALPDDRALPRRGPQRRRRRRLAVAAIATGRLDLLARRDRDRLHEPYRARRLPGAAGHHRRGARRRCAGCRVSGAGSTVIAFADDPERAAEVGAAMTRWAADHDLPGRSVITRPRARGAFVVE